MNNKIVLAIILLISVVGGFFVFTKSNHQNEMVEKTVVKAQPTAMVRSYSLEEVAKHSTESDCWMAIENKVYNVTDYVSKHPGGKAILGGCGKDATTLFNERPTNNKGPHPEAAKEMLLKLEIGDLNK